MQDAPFGGRRERRGRLAAAWRRAAVAAALVAAGLAGCGGGPIVEQNETLEVAGIEYRVVRAGAVPGTEPTVVTVTVRATNVTRERRQIYGAERSPVAFVVLSGGRRIETVGEPDQGVLGAGETITFTLRAETGATEDLALQLLSSRRYPLSGNEGRIELRDVATGGPQAR